MSLRCRSHRAAGQAEARDRSSFPMWNLSQAKFSTPFIAGRAIRRYKTHYPIDVPTWAALNGRLFVGLSFKQIEPSNK
jgi:hypothetical protein